MPELLMHLTVRDLVPGDLPSCAWSGRATHVAAVRWPLNAPGAARSSTWRHARPSGLPVGLGGIDYAKTSGAGTIWMLDVHRALQSSRIGTVLIRGVEQRICTRGWAELGVEDSNPRARSLYERLGYTAYGSEPDSWDQEAADGTITRYDTMLTLVRKELP